MYPALTDPHPRHGTRGCKGRFRMLANGDIKYQRAGHVHKRFNKSNRQRRELGQAKIMDPAFARMFKKLGFKSRTY